jgi:hypothetical protein
MIAGSKYPLIVSLITEKKFSRDDGYIKNAKVRNMQEEIKR